MFIKAINYSEYITLLLYIIIFPAGRLQFRNVVPAMSATFAFDGPEDAH